MTSLLFLFSLVFQLGNEDFQTRELASKTLKEIVFQYDLNSFIERQIELSEDPEIKSRLISIKLSYENIGVIVPLRFFSESPQSLLENEDKDLSEIVEKYQLVVNYGNYYYYSANTDDTWLYCTNLYLKKKFNKGLTRNQVKELLDKAYKNKENYQQMYPYSSP